MRLALTDLFKAHWTDRIHQEWINALLRQGKFSRERLERVRDLMDAHVRDAKVEGYESLIEMLRLPDPDDRHVLAAAIRCGLLRLIVKTFRCIYWRLTELMCCTRMTLFTTSSIWRPQFVVLPSEVNVSR